MHASVKQAGLCMKNNIDLKLFQKVDQQNHMSRLYFKAIGFGNCSTEF